MNILVVDDEVLIRNVIKEYLLLEGYSIFEADNGESALEIIDKNNIDLIVMDIMMPNLDGFSACKEIRKNKNIPIIVLSARTEEFDKLYGFEIGIDDYITKPFSPKELIARIKAILKRNNKLIDEYRFNDLVINNTSRIVKIENNEIKLTPKEYDLLLYLIQNKDIALSRENLLSNVWGYDFFGDERTVDTHIKMLRNNLGKYRKYIVTVRGFGYKFTYEK